MSALDRLSRVAHKIGTAFDRDVEIVVRPHKKGSKAARIRFSPMAA
jgi:hypothetical protein